MPVETIEAWDGGIAAFDDESRRQKIKSAMNYVWDHGGHLRESMLRFAEDVPDDIRQTLTPVFDEMTMAADLDDEMERMKERAVASMMAMADQLPPHWDPSAWVMKRHAEVAAS